MVDLSTTAKRPGQFHYSYRQALVKLLSLKRSAVMKAKRVLRPVWHFDIVSFPNATPVQTGRCERKKKKEVDDANETLHNLASLLLTNKTICR